MAEKETLALSRVELSLENCDREPVHIPGHIQPCAVLLATDPDLKIITHCSENVDAMLGRPVSEVLGAKLKDLFSETVLHSLNNTLSLGASHVQRERVSEWKQGSNLIEMWAHFSGTVPVIELEVIKPETYNQPKSIMIVRSLLGHLSQINDMQRYLNDAVFGLRNLSGFDRVLLYQFDENGDGEVTAEACGPNSDPFIGLRFPKWDIPNQAREIMKKLPLRLISNVKAKSVKLCALDDTGPPLDLTFAASRGTSPIHVEYLSNMGVTATMSLSIIVSGKLWGLFAFHHKKPRHIEPSLRGAAELFVQFFSLQLEQKFENIRNRIRSDILSYRSDLLNVSNSVMSVSALFRDVAKPFCKILAADGVAVISKDDVFRQGETPEPAMIREIAQSLLRGLDKSIAVNTNLKLSGFENRKSAGALAFVLDHHEAHYVVFFRKEAILSVKWAGAPEKEIIESHDGPRLIPRGSFKAFSESIKERSLPWDETDLMAAEEIRKALVKADENLIRRLSHQDERQRSLFIAELNHRVRNILALIRSLARRTQKSAHSLDTYAIALEARIVALGKAHDLAANQITSGVSLIDLFETELNPYADAEYSQYSITGDNYVLRSDIAPIFALVAHELVTNCVKYGALSHKDGMISLHIEAAPENGKNGIQILWEERGGKDIQPPTEQGFGLGLINKTVPYMLDGQTHIKFHPHGLSVRFWLPETLIMPMQAHKVNSSQTPKPVKPAQNSGPKQAFVLEDNLMIAMDMSDMLKTLGVEIVETFATIEQAKNGLLKNEPPDIAILDISLRDTLSFEFAEILVRENIPFCFATGYSSNYDIPSIFEAVPVLTKPVNIKALKATLKAISIRAV